MRKRKSLLSLLLSLTLLLSTVVVPAHAADVPTLTVTPNVTQIDVGTGTADVVYTIKLNPNGNKVGAFQFELSAPKGMTLPAAFTVDGKKVITYVNKADMAYNEEEGTGIFPDICLYTFNWLFRCLWWY